MEMLFGSLLISGSKVRVLDGPPMKAGASRASEAPADFRAADVGSVTPKSDESARPINNGQTRDRKDPLATAAGGDDYLPGVSPTLKIFAPTASPTRAPRIRKRLGP